MPLIPPTSWFLPGSFMWDSVCCHPECKPHICPALPSDSDGNELRVVDFSDIFIGDDIFFNQLPEYFIGTKFPKLSSFLSKILVNLQVSQQYVSTEIIFQLKILRFCSSTVSL